MTQRILVVEDDARIADLISKNLEAVGYECHRSPDGGNALADFAKLKPALVVLDLGLPGVDGLEVTRRIRKESDVPILMVTARSGESDKLLGLELGADDYITKPFSTAELVARVRALLRRHARGTEGSAQFVFGDVNVDLSRRSVLRQGQPVHLTALEYRLLAQLLANVGKVLTHRHLLREVWGPTFVESNHYVRIYVARLRQKLEVDPAQPRHLLTEIGVGYRFQL